MLPRSASRTSLSSHSCWCCITGGDQLKLPVWPALLSRSPDEGELGSARCGGAAAGRGAPPLGDGAHPGGAHRGGRCCGGVAAAGGGVGERQGEEARRRSWSSLLRGRSPAACARCCCSGRASSMHRHLSRACVWRRPCGTPHRAAGFDGAAGGVSSSIASASVASASVASASVASAFCRSAAVSSAAVSRGGVVRLEVACDGCPRTRGELCNRAEPSRPPWVSCGSLSCSGSGLAMAPSERAFLPLGGGPAGRSRSGRKSPTVCARRCSGGVVAATVIAMRPAQLWGVHA